MPNRLGLFVVYSGSSMLFLVSLFKDTAEIVYYIFLFLLPLEVDEYLIDV